MDLQYPGKLLRESVLLNNMRQSMKENDLGIFMNCTNYCHTCDLSRSGVKLPICYHTLRPPDEAAKIPIFMNSDFSLFTKAKTSFPIMADACFF